MRETYMPSKRRGLEELWRKQEQVEIELKTSRA
jgi:hypothetical protein